MPGKRNKKHDLIKSVERRGDTVIVKLSGEIDLHCSIPLRDELVEIMHSKPAVTIINLEDVDFMDSTGLAIMIEVLQLSRLHKGQLKLVSLHQRVRSIFEIARLEKIFQIYDDEEAALASEAQ